MRAGIVRARLWRPVPSVARRVSTLPTASRHPPSSVPLQITADVPIPPSFADKLVASSVWLRDACPCPLCVTPSSGQKTFATFDIPPAIRPHRVHIASDFSLHVTWTPDVPAAPATHTSVFPAAYLSALRLRHPADSAASFRAPRRAVDLLLWDAARIARHVRRIPYADFLHDAAALHAGLLDLEALGLLFITHVPRDAESVVRIGTRINALQETFYGRAWDVVSKPHAENVAYTAGFLGLHQDMLYVRQPPRIQLLHCLDNSCRGGASLFSDAKHAAQLLLDSPAAHVRRAVDLLAELCVRYHYAAPPFLYRNAWPVLELTPERRLMDVWWSPPFQAPNPPVDPRAAGLTTREAEERSREWLQAMRMLRELIEREDHVYETKLEAGECVVFDNRRVLHARRAFDTATGKRWLRGTYISDEDFRSRMQSVPADVVAEYGRQKGLEVLREEVCVEGGRTALEYFQGP
ncbi:hypothetical protein TD95_002650 [Thielaviopsis punctulata]|uniref:TauD/TfdA-like domain-containing protein n=1 Tax=Thielaviopsis punctulata TaxID=72032 RepID=A0A0F4Z9Y0_9PEZI|nr:hypothetical protein TD95_002650 [Thielaviopsis punctulata]